jgi:prepilin-type N-terminal cleavage/methylation domain-containing protein
MGVKLIRYNEDCSTGCYSAKPVRSQSRLYSEAGYTLVELLVVILIMGVVLSIALPQLAANLEQGRKAKCLSNRYNIDQDERNYYLKNNAPSLAIDSRYQCASGGTYVWLISDPASSEYPRIGCSLHYGDIPADQITAPLTSLGSTFTEITTAMIDLINKYRQAHNGDYPDNSGKAAYTDLGLDRADWRNIPVNGLIYTPAGDQVIVEPAPGYTMTMNYVNGGQLILTSKSKSDLVYDVKKDAWYGSNNDKKAVDISTLKVVKN